MENEDKVLKALEKYMKAIRCWPEDGQKFSLLFSIKGASPILVVFAPIQLGVLGHFYKSISGGVLSDVITDSFYLTLFAMFSMSAALYLYKGEEFLRIKEEFSIHKYGKPKNLNKLNEKIDKITHLIYYYWILFCFCFLPFWCFWETDCLTKKDSNGEIMQGYIRGLVCPAWFPFNLEIFPWKLIILISSSLQWFWFGPSMSTMIILGYAFVKLMVNRIEHLSELTKEINFMDINKELTRAKLRICIKYYSEIVSLSKDVNDIVGTIYAPSQNGLMVVMIGLLEYEIVLEKNAVALGLLIFYMTAEAVACYSGQILEDACERLREDVYDLAWYEMDPTVRKDFKLFHAFVQETLYLKIKPNLNMNMAHYYTVMKGAYSLMMYFTRF